MGEVDSDEVDATAAESTVDGAEYDVVAIGLDESGDDGSGDDASGVPKNCFSFCDVVRFGAVPALGDDTAAARCQRSSAGPKKKKTNKLFLVRWLVLLFFLTRR